jgi:hypothetical protein
VPPPCPIKTGKEAFGPAAGGFSCPHGGGTAFAEKLCGYLVRATSFFASARNGARRPMHRRGRYIGDFRDRREIWLSNSGRGNSEKTGWEPRAPLTCTPEALTAGDRFRAGVGFVVQITAK